MRPSPEAETHIRKQEWQYVLTASVLKRWRQEHPGLTGHPASPALPVLDHREPDYKPRQIQSDYWRQSAVPIAQSVVKHASEKRVRDFEALSLKWEVFIQSPPLKAQIKCEGVGRRKIVGVRGGGWLQGNCIFQTQEHTDSHVDLQRLQRNAQARTRENLSTGKGKQTCIWVQGLYYQFAFFFFFFLAFGCFCLLTCLILEEERDFHFFCFCWIFCLLFF